MTPPPHTHAHRDVPEDLCPVYRPGEWEQLPSERDLNPFSRYEALNPKRPIILDDFGTGKGMNYFLLGKIEIHVLSWKYFILMVFVLWYQSLFSIFDLS